MDCSPVFIQVQLDEGLCHLFVSRYMKLSFDEAMCSGPSPTAGRGLFVHGNNNLEDEGGSLCCT